MSTTALLGFAALVFTLMITGLILTMREFLRLSDDPSIKKGADVQEDAVPARPAPRELKVVGR